MISLGDVTAILMLTVVLVGPVGFQVSEVVSFFQIRFSHKNTNKDLQINTCPFMVHCHMSGAWYRPQSDLTIEFFAQLFMSHHIHIQDHDIISP